MTFAELLAFVGMCAPANLRALDPIVAAVPLLAQRLGATIDDVCAMPARTVADAVAVEFADWISDSVKAEAEEAVRAVEEALDPARMRERMMRRGASDQS